MNVYHKMVDIACLYHYLLLLVVDYRIIHIQCAIGRLPMMGKKKRKRNKKSILIMVSNSSRAKKLFEVITDQLLPNLRLLWKAQREGDLFALDPLFLPRLFSSCIRLRCQTLLHALPLVLQLPLILLHPTDKRAPHPNLIPVLVKHKWNRDNSHLK